MTTDNQNSPVAPQGVVAWMHPETLDVIHADRKQEWATRYGLGGQSKAEGYSVAMVRADQSAAGAAPALEAPAAPAGDLFDCEVRPHPLRYPLAAYHHAPGNGPLHATWQDKPHRIVYDLVAAVRHYAALAAAPQAPATEPVARAIFTNRNKPDVEWLVDSVTRGMLLYAAPQAPAAPVAVPWDNFPAYLIDHCEGQTITEEGLQRALAAMLANPQYAPAAPAAPAVDARDTARMDWLQTKAVSVREPMHDGPSEIFWSGPVDRAGMSAGPSDLRARIDAAQAAAKGAGEQ